MLDTDLAAAVASRICHDLVSPVGAVVNGVDLMRDADAGDWSEAVGMIGQSAGRASALLQFHRIAFGAVGAEAQPVGRGTLRKLASVLAQPPRVLLEWEGGAASLPRAEARLLALMLLCARSVAGMRGTIRVRAPEGRLLPLAVAVETEAFSGTVDMLDHLAGARDEEKISPRTVEFLLARDAARQLDLSLAVERTEDRATIRVGAASRG